MSKPADGIKPNLERCYTTSYFEEKEISQARQIYKFYIAIMYPSVIACMQEKAAGNRRYQLTKGSGGMAAVPCAAVE